MIGGGYIAVEYAHFFAAMGAKVTVIEMADRLVLSEEPEIAAMLLEELTMDFRVLLHAIFSYPQVASVGLGEGKAKESYKIL